MNNTPEQTIEAGPRSKIHAGWRSLLFPICFGALVLPLMAVARKLFAGKFSSLERGLIRQMTAMAAVLLATWLLARFVDKTSISSFGLQRELRSRHLALGLLWGVVSLSCLIGLLMASGVLHLGSGMLSGGDIASYAVRWFILFVAVGISEELLTRGYWLYSLTEAIGFWPAATLLSVLFASGHLYNPGERVTGILSAGLIGLILAWSVRRTGTLWWAIGYHTSWDWAQSFLYGVPNSGTKVPGHFLDSTISGPCWLSGGSVGPEGSVLVLPVMALLVYVLYRWTPQTEAARNGQVL